jgi:hypothetical protein
MELKQILTYKKYVLEKEKKKCPLRTHKHYLKSKLSLYETC